jgi:uncharacterized protein
MALARQLNAWPEVYSSDLLAVEARRAAARYGADVVARVAEKLEDVFLVPMSAPVRDRAAILEPPQLRSLDAIHLATALRFGDRLGALYAYDHRLIEAAQAAGLRVLSPGA